MRSLDHLPAVAPAPAPPAWRVWLCALLDLVFPAFCPVCGSALAAGRRDPLCGGCWERVQRLTPPWCGSCGLGITQFETDDGTDVHPARTPHRCGECRRRSPEFTYARSAVLYDDVIREALHAFKFRGKRALAAPLGDLLAEIGRASLPILDPDLLVPVPLHPRRERERGFNQAALLARRLGRAWRLPVRTDVIARTVATTSQSRLTALERRANVRGAFSLRRPEIIAGRHVIVIDDIMTTGSTVGACAASLREGGAATVGVLTVARVL